MTVDRDSFQMTAVSVKAKEIGLDQQYEPFAVYLGQGGVDQMGKPLQFVHLVYDQKDKADAAVANLHAEHQIFRHGKSGAEPINVNQYDERAPKSLQGKFFCRIFANDFEKKFDVNLAELEVRPSAEDEAYVRNRDNDTHHSNERSSCVIS